MNTSYLCIGLLLVTAHVSFIATATRIFCRAPVSPDEPANISCYFPENINQSKTSFGLLCPSSNGSRAEQCFGCTWKDGQPLCDGEEGFKLISQVSSNATFAIPPHKHGTFLCDTIPPNKTVALQSCNFTVLKATRIFCQSPPVSVSDPATLTCHFPEDLSQIRKGIAVLRRDSIPGSQYEFLLGCAWDNRKLVCGVFYGYRLLTQHPTYDVTFQIPSHEPGTFRCVYIPADEVVTVESCNFTLKATRTFCRVPPIPEGDPATLICHYPEDLSQSRKSIAVLRRDSIPGSQYERLVGCTWNKEKLACGVRHEIKLITRQPMYDVTFQIESRQPGTFLCHITKDEAVTVQSCNFTLKGSDPSRDTTDWSQRRNEDSDRFPVTAIVFIAIGLFPITVMPAIFLIVRFCRRRSRGSASPLVLKHGKRESQTKLAMKEMQPFRSTLVEDPEYSVGQTPSQLAEESHSVTFRVCNS